MFERFTDRARTVVKLARAKADERGDQIRPVYLLHGLLGAAERNPRGDFTPATLRDLGLDPGQVRRRVLDELRHAPA